MFLGILSGYGRDSCCLVLHVFISGTWLLFMKRNELCVSGCTQRVSSTCMRFQPLVNLHMMSRKFENRGENENVKLLFGLCDFSPSFLLLPE